MILSLLTRHVIAHVPIKYRAMERHTRTYTIALGPSQDAIDVHVSEERHKLALAWILLPCGERRTTYLKLDGDEREIISAALSRDKRRLIVVVEYELGRDSRPVQIQMKLSDLLPEESRAILEQADVQTIVRQAQETSEKPQRHIHWCFTETRDVLNRK